MIRQVSLLALFFFIAPFAKSQCVNIFPYHEDFENGPGNWFSGGTKNDWALGTPAKPTINKAASGTKCWIVGGLNASSYADGESSWVQSPCFDFTNLQHPYIKFSYFWESEQKYDGGNLQYSLDGGSLWKNAGQYNNPVDCLDSNWYNTANIKYLSVLAAPQNGWSGNIQTGNSGCSTGGGSGKWVVCQHCLTNLAGLPNVVFRFTFGAGTSCNNFDGNAFDNIYIENAPPVVPDFSFACQGNNVVSFTDLSTLCPDKWTWNFGDANSTDNTSMLQNPQHSFSGPGTYTVSLIAGNDCSGNFTITKQVSILGLTVQMLIQGCFGLNNGIAIASATGSIGGNYIYNWNPPVSQAGDSAKDLAPGNYAVIVTAGNACSASAAVVITTPTQLRVKEAVQQPLCSGQLGNILLKISGGIAPYSYKWLPDISTAPSATNIDAGIYEVSISDKDNCILKDTITINAAPPIIIIALQGIADTCNRPNGSASANVSGGIPPYKYRWAPGNENTDSINHLTGNISYQLLVTDSNNCRASASILIPDIDGFNIYLGADTMLCNGNAVTLSPGNGFISYQWQDGSTQPTLTVGASGTYWVNVSNGACSASDTIRIIPCDPELYVPSGFSPNGDGKNDLFLPITRQEVSHYHLRVFNRWGQLIFETTSINAGWDGTFNGKNCDMEAYVYCIEYNFGQGDKLAKGTITLIR